MDALFYWTGAAAWAFAAVAAGVAIYRAVLNARSKTDDDGWPQRKTLDQVLAEMTSIEHLPPRDSWKPESYPLSALLNVGRRDGDVFRMFEKPVRYRYADASLVVQDQSGYGFVKADFDATHWVVVAASRGGYMRPALKNDQREPHEEAG